MFPEKMTLGFGLFRMKEEDMTAESEIKNLDKLGGKGDFGDEENGGLATIKSFKGEGEIEVSFAAAGDTME